MFSFDIPCAVKPNTAPCSTHHTGKRNINYPPSRALKWKGKGFECQALSGTYVCTGKRQMRVNNKTIQQANLCIGHFGHPEKKENSITVATQQVVEAHILQSKFIQRQGSQESET